ncbi:iron-sulfur protein NUBPL isoform X1 [Panicum miliaceum]|uniref:Nucleotide-binding protein-like n=1 Tax=Panicum miliaceum TaxID=4540 RepID=A0A3L6SCP2_PANMI|nr:iron-sulfur protein NUBPL isoform X1 [Panicum miliaceum]
MPMINSLLSMAGDFARKPHGAWQYLQDPRRWFEIGWFVIHADVSRSRSLWLGNYLPVYGLRQPIQFLHGSGLSLTPPPAPPPFLLFRAAYSHCRLAPLFAVQWNNNIFSMLRIASRRAGSLGGRRSYSALAKGGPSIAGVGDIIAVASGKGGVGKSTTAVNIAVALSKEFKLKVGLLDADIYGPSIPTMMNLHAKPEVTEDMKMIPTENHGVRCMSIGFLVDKDAPIVWRGPMVMSALEKMTRGVAWGNLDVLVVDMPPGTGDAQLSMSQRLRLSGALIVSTPQDIALIDARRGANMFRKVQVPILGLVENMSCFKCPKCGENSYIFGEGGAKRTAEEMDMKLLGEIPLEIGIRTCSDEGKPIVISSPNSASAQAYIHVAEKVTERLKELANERQKGPEILL